MRVNTKFTWFAAFSLVLTTFAFGCGNDLLPLSPSVISTDNANSANSEGGTVNPVSEVRKAVGDIIGANASPLPCGPVPSVVKGTELNLIRGWWANIYPWEFNPKESPLYPIPELFTPNQRQTPGQIIYQNRLLDQYGSGLDVLEYNPNPVAADHNHWLNTYFTSGSRKFFLLYEHIYGTRFRPVNGGPKDMSDPYNRKVFLEDLDFMFKNVISCYQSGYVTVNGRAVIYMWSSGQMIGDFAGLLEEARSRYPVFFIGSNEDFDNLERIIALDGLMEYSLAGFGGPAGNYALMMKGYIGHAGAQREALNSIRRQIGKKVYLFATFQAAYDDTLVVPRRNNSPLYPRTRGEMEEHARLVRMGLTRWRIFDGGPFAVFSELPEGGAVLPTIPRPEPPDKYVGYGTGRMDVLRKCFGGGRC